MRSVGNRSQDFPSHSTPSAFFPSCPGPHLPTTPPTDRARVLFFSEQKNMSDRKEQHRPCFCGDLLGLSLALIDNDVERVRDHLCDACASAACPQGTPFFFSAQSMDALLLFHERKADLSRTNRSGDSLFARILDGAWESKTGQNYLVRSVPFLIEHYPWAVLGAEPASPFAHERPELAAVIRAQVEGFAHALRALLESAVGAFAEAVIEYTPLNEYIAVLDPQYFPKAVERYKRTVASIRKRRNEQARLKA